MRFTSVPLSVGLHVAVISAAVFVAWPGRERERQYIPPIPIEVISQAELSDRISVPETTKAEDEPVEEPEAEAPEEVVEEEPAPEPEPEPEPAPAEPEPEPEPAPVEEEPEPDPEPEVVEEEPEPEPEQKEPEKKPEPQQPAPQPEEDLLGDLNDSLLDLDPDKKRNAPKVVNPGAASGERDQERIGEGDTLSVTEEAKLAACVRQNYTLDKTARGWEDFFIRVRVKLSIDGNLSGPVEVLNQGEINRSGNAAYQAAARNAVAAISSCFPLEGLDPARYHAWDSFTYEFHPEEF